MILLIKVSRECCWEGGGKGHFCLAKANGGRQNCHRLHLGCTRLHKVAQGWTGVDLSPERFRSSLHRSSKLHQVRTLWILHWCTLHRANLHHKLCKEECDVVKILLLHLSWVRCRRRILRRMHTLVPCNPLQGKLTQNGHSWGPSLWYAMQKPILCWDFCQKTGERCDRMQLLYYELGMALRLDWPFFSTDIIFS